MKVTSLAHLSMIIGICLLLGELIVLVDVLSITYRKSVLSFMDNRMADIAISAFVGTVAPALAVTGILLARIGKSDSAEIAHTGFALNIAVLVIDVIYMVFYGYVLARH